MGSVPEGRGLRWKWGGKQGGEGRGGAAQPPTASPRTPQRSLDLLPRAPSIYSGWAQHVCAALPCRRLALSAACFVVGGTSKASSSSGDPRSWPCSWALTHLLLVSVLFGPF